jgi:hypothetical protein
MQVQEEEGDCAAAVALYLRAGTPGRAAALLIRQWSNFDQAAVETVLAALAGAGLHERAGEVCCLVWGVCRGSAGLAASGKDARLGAWDQPQRCPARAAKCSVAWRGCVMQVLERQGKHADAMAAYRRGRAYK